MNWKHKDLLDLDILTAEEIKHILKTAAPMKEILARPNKKLPTLRGKSVVMLFYENSTRTRTSFETAAKILGADTSNIAVAQSSVSKGETLLDTAKTLQAMKVDLVVIRHGSSGVAGFLADELSAGVINGGDGQHAHPTQALLDFFTMQERLGELQGKKIVIVGDVLHSRVVRSNVLGLKKLGAEVVLVGPPTLLPSEMNYLGVKTSYDLDKELPGADAVMALRLQLERQQSGLFPSIREYSRLYGLSLERLKQTGKDTIIMHPGPMNRGVEITSDLADSVQSVIEEQVTNGVAVRMALIYLLIGGTGSVVD
ncbi:MULTISPECIES: aspartate carbamoyltransferase catalytic subunit [Dehalobacter]|uniref:Aspartate carbamoyltransferase n=2 Tax=Dehalobacter restrictus TaxID=55583 RepID=A0A857DL64_9FIRM|nr:MULTISPECIES: aspartate carbamoyltransferase catalytic subunit [Dehalobacter]AHF10545.1 aspartate carbamoyltransferase [Dehalobacter restrictus DSM 9455]MCG1026289.1 aspartate carbamoyltransferase catalytic subunit [Dehalobacter sp.]MDJ0306701.1 aspartate carbamoyltransferase catalytic subunit [Dehalobacter sp.]OCZ50822.1 aspartate carbamoyltransferase [Dehalobacter sp. TeCB1]QHA01169.1 aspartate carbamoyltransferase catalytic subunit [Dehalobacter restrictus]